MTNLEQALVLMRDLWTLLAKADEMMAEAMDAMELAADEERAMVPLPTLLSGLDEGGNTGCP